MNQFSRNFATNIDTSNLSFVAIEPPRYYSLLIQALVPLYTLIVRKKSKNNAHYQQELADRFGKRYSNTTREKQECESLVPIVWCHAVSLGETNTIAPIIESLLSHGYHIWMTNTTQTGYARVQKIFADYLKAGTMHHSYMPVDTYNTVNNFLNYIKPVLALFVETELWPTTLSLLTKKKITSVLINARLSEKSFHQYAKFSQLSKSMMNNLSYIIAQDELSAQRFQQLGADQNKITIAPSLKWYVDIHTEPLTTAQNSLFNSIQQRIGERNVWVAASTHDQEEDIIIATHKLLLQQEGFRDVLLIIVPRHPERFSSVQALLDTSQLSYKTRSLEQLPDTSTAVFLADTMGELCLWYKLADCAFIGGSLVNVGGHNPIEAVAQGVPVIMGKYTESCQAIVDELKEQNILTPILGDYEHKKNKLIDTDIKNELSTTLCIAINNIISQDKKLDDIAERAKDLVATRQQENIQQSLLYEIVASRQS